MISSYTAMPKLFAISFLLLPCTEWAGMRRFVYQPSAECGWYASYALALFSILLTSGCMALLGCFMYRNKPLLQRRAENNMRNILKASSGDAVEPDEEAQQEAQDATSVSEEERETAAFWAYLSRGYEPEYWYWDLLIMSRKALFGAAMVYAPLTTNSAMLFTLLFIILFMSTVAHTFARPYVDIELDRTEGLSLVVSVGSLIMGSYIEISKDNRIHSDWEWASYVVTLIMIILNSSFLLVFLALALPALWQTYGPKLCHMLGRDKNEGEEGTAMSTPEDGAVSTKTHHPNNEPGTVTTSSSASDAMPDESKLRDRKALRRSRKKAGVLMKESIVVEDKSAINEQGDYVDRVVLTI